MNANDRLERLWSEHNASVRAYARRRLVGRRRRRGGRADRELLLIAWEGLDHAQAAAALGISANAFGVRLHRARKRLAAALDRGNLSEAHPQERLNA